MLSGTVTEHQQKIKHYQQLKQSKKVSKLPFVAGVDSAKLLSSSETLLDLEMSSQAQTFAPSVAKTSAQQFRKRVNQDHFTASDEHEDDIHFGHTELQNVNSSNTGNPKTSQSQQSLMSAQKDFDTPQLNRQDKDQKLTPTASPDEVDALVVSQPQSLETDLISKESFNTDKIRKDNLNQNFIMRSGHWCSDIVEDKVPLNNSIQSPEVLTFGANSVLGVKHNAISNSQKKIITSDALSGLQEIYSMHQFNLGGTQEDSNKVISVLTGEDERADTPNLYQNLSHESTKTVHQTDLSNPQTQQTQFCETDNPPPRPEERQLSKNNNHKNLPKTDGKTKFLLQLNAIHKVQELGLGVDNQEGFNGRIGGAIRVEKQASFTKSPSESSQSGGGLASNAKQESLMTGGESRRSESYGVTSAFAAAEFKVRNSQIQIFNNSNPESLDSQDVKDVESIDVTAPALGSLAFKSHAETQGPPIIIQPQQTQSVDQMINEIALTPARDHDSPSNHQKISVFGEEIQYKQMNFLQQLIDTQGPNEGPTNITVLPLSGSLSDQLMMTQLGYGGDSCGNKTQKHSRAIAFQDGGVDADGPPPSDMPHFSPVKVEVEPNSTIVSDIMLHSSKTNTYRELVSQNNLTQDSGPIGYDQPTTHLSGQCIPRNPLVGGFSDRKQLSTVEEENASQCSDFTTVHQHHSRLLQTQQSSLSRVSGHRSSLPVAGLHSSGHKLPQPFNISEDPSGTVDAGVRDAYNDDLLQNNQTLSLSYWNKQFSSNEAGGGQEAVLVGEEANDKLKIGFIPSANLSLNSTKAQTSHATFKNTTSLIGDQSKVPSISNSAYIVPPTSQQHRQQKKQKIRYQQQLSDYYRMNSSNNSPQIQSSPHSDELSLRMAPKDATRKVVKTTSPPLVNVSIVEEESPSSILLDLDQNEGLSVSGELVSPVYVQNQQSKAQKELLDAEAPQEEKRKLFSQSPYMVSAPQDDQITHFGNFSKAQAGAQPRNKGLDQNASAAHTPSGEGAQTQQSELLESVHLTCSENLDDESGSSSKHDSAALIYLIDNMNVAAKSRASTQNKEELQSSCSKQSTTLQNSSSTKKKQCIKKTPSKPKLELKVSSEKRKQHDSESSTLTQILTQPQDKSRRVSEGSFQHGLQRKFLLKDPQADSQDEQLLHSVKLPPAQIRNQNRQKFPIQAQDSTQKKTSLRRSHGKINHKCLPLKQRQYQQTALKVATRPGPVRSSSTCQLKENLGQGPSGPISTQSTPFSDRECKRYSNHSHKQLTPVFEQKNLKVKPIKTHPLSSQKLFVTPQHLIKAKKSTELGFSERKLNFQPLGSGTNSHSSVLLLSQMPKQSVLTTCQSNSAIAPPPQPLFKQQKEAFGIVNKQKTVLAANTPLRTTPKRGSGIFTSGVQVAATKK